MKKIHIKIRDFFNNCIAVDILPDCDEQLFYKVIETVQNKVAEAFELQELVELKENESIETVKLALWKLQKSLVEKVSVNPVKLLNGKYAYKTIHKFYDRETGVITITKFKEEGKWFFWVWS